MKAVVILAAAGAASLANAKPHGHGHAHRHHKREPDAVTVSEAVSTALAYVLNGQPISQDEVCSGIASGDLKWAGEVPADACAAASSISVSMPTPMATSAAATSAAAAQFYAQSTSATSSAAAAVTTSVAAPSSSSSSSRASSSSVSSSSNTSGKFVAPASYEDYPDFQDGVHACSDGVPSGYGAINVDYLGLNGWLGLQQLNSAQTNVVSDSSTCGEGVACSYACEVGMQKMQWPSTQPANGVSVGGLLCKNGYLYKTNDNPKLCSAGTGGVSVTNTGDKDICICRTDYPGLESETVPMDVEGGATQPLTCPDESTYYKHLGSLTSAQYYLNQPGVVASVGCSWNGNGDGQSGNWAPLNIGVGETAGTKWLSLFQNSPTSTAVFQGNVNITGSGISTSCTYTVDADGKDGEYCGGSTCCKVSSGNNCGCTAAVTGDAVFVVSF